MPSHLGVRRAAMRPRGGSHLLLVFIVGCGEGANQTAINDAAQAVRRSAQDEDVTLTLTADDSDIEQSTTLRLRVEASAENGVLIDPPDYASVLAQGEQRFDYRVMNVHKQPPTPTSDGRTRQAIEYELEFVLPGDYELPPATLSYTLPTSDRDGAGGRRELKTEPLPIHVRDPSSRQLSVEELRTLPPLSPVELPDPWRWGRWAMAAVGLLILALAMGFFLHRRAREAAKAPLIPAHEWARRQFAALLADDLLPRGKAREFHYRVSDIVRGYVERRFHVAAPDMTTEEFLAAVTRDARFGDADRAELANFLAACDMVKYAKRQPLTEESEHVLQTAMEFVERTRERPFPTAAERAAMGAAQERAA